MHCRKEFGFSFTSLKGKIPQIKGWQNAPLESVPDLQNWVSRGNLGLRTGRASGGILVIDLDCSKPAYNFEKVKALNLPDTVTVQTGSGGYHLYYRLPVGVDFGNSANKLAPCVDTRGTGGQVVFAGSIHPDTNRPYVFMPGKTPWDIAIAELPGHIVKLLSTPEKSAKPNSISHPSISQQRTTSYAKTALFDEMQKVSMSPEGSRNDTLNSAAYSLGQLIAGGILDETLTIKSLKSAGYACGLSLDEIENTIASGLAAGKKEPRGIPEISKPQKPAANLESKTIPDSIQEQIIPDGKIDPASNKVVLSTDNTLPTAEAFILDFETVDNTRTLHTYNEYLFKWDKHRYVIYEYEAMKKRLHHWLHNALQYVGKGKSKRLQQFPGNPNTVSQALQTIIANVHLPKEFEVPFYVSGDTSKPNPRELVCCQNCNLHVPTMIEYPVDPDLFNYNSLNFDFNRDADHPETWYNFLNAVWPDDPESIQLLKEWFGYCITADTSQQKMLFIQGPPRSGKGTIARVLQELIGKQNYVAPTTSTLASQYGLAEFIRKSLACVSDARFSGADAKIILERILNISGEDTLTIERKYKSAVTMKLPLRLMFLSNELPSIQDSSGAFTKRMLLLVQKHSFVGKEDPTLTKRLLNELPGILIWALEGWHDLKDRLKFKLPQSSIQAMKEMAELVSPIKGFVADCCELGEGKKVVINDLYEAYKKWSERAGWKFRSTVQGFGRDLSSAIPSLDRGQSSDGKRYYKNIALRYGWDIEGNSEDQIKIPD